MLSLSSRLRRRFLSSLFALVLSIGFAVPACAVDFLVAIQDIPLPAGFAELGDSVEFETPFGRIVETSAQGQGSSTDTEFYYQSAMPAFGWTLVEKPLVFERKMERLYIRVINQGAVQRVDFKLVVKPSSSKMND